MGEGRKIRIYSIREVRQGKSGRKGEICLTKGEDDKEELQGNHEGTVLLQTGGKVLADGQKCCIASEIPLQREGWGR